jgi:hypothetical protein
MADQRDEKLQGNIFLRWVELEKCPAYRRRLFGTHALKPSIERCVALAFISLYQTQIYQNSRLGCCRKLPAVGIRH